MLARVLVPVATLACVPVLGVATARAADPLVEVDTPHSAAFSPNGDGHKDSLPVRFRLAERAQVTVRIPDVGTVDLGTRGPGPSVWRWDGHGAPNGSYRLVVQARTRDGRTGRDTTFAEIDRGQSLARVRVYTTRTTVYPQTPGKQDRIYVRSTKEGNATEVTVRDRAGAVVTDTAFRHWWSWDGAGQPAGEYDATFSVHDRFGNRREIRRTLRVSDDHLVQETWSATSPAADVALFPRCGTSPSARFVHGLTVATGPACDWAFFIPRFDLPVDADPDVTWRFTVAGGPTTPGSDQTALVYVADGLDVVATRTATGDTTTTTPWGGPHAYEWDPEREPEPTGWVLVHDPDTSYDVAEVTLEVRYWAPPAS
ncbi:hypothetical protein [Nocardioides sp.]|uniref:hypothetical protein n=1 Tax=Nocardioides sp. TaxID=35761 RepID=UPI0037838F5F